MTATNCAHQPIVLNYEQKLFPGIFTRKTTKMCLKFDLFDEKAKCAQFVRSHFKQKRIRFVEEIISNNTNLSNKRWERTDAEDSS